MSAKSDGRNQYRSPPGFAGMPGRSTPQAKAPLNVAFGGTTGGPNNYGTGRGAPVMRDPNDLRQWFAGRGTSQDRYAKTRLPGDY